MIKRLSEAQLPPHVDVCELANNNCIRLYILTVLLFSNQTGERFLSVP